MILAPGASFGAYKIVAPLGRGGMGEVYRARDTRLGREVALKILREEGAADPDRIRRFEDEARAASSLNHPNIVVVYEVGDATLPGENHPSRYLAMELLEGKPLHEVLSVDRIPLKRFLDLAIQLTDGLARAHESGIIHRDLKPSNILVTPDGRVKILDFGLAKLKAIPDENSSSSPTVDETVTTPGAVLGTVGYMSPEQARGEPATAASDQFSLGCIFYEMLTGRLAFSGKSPADILSAILRDDPPPVEESNPDVPAPLRWIVERCLSKSPAERYVSTRDLARELQILREHASGSTLRGLPGAARRRSAKAPRIAGAVVLVAAVGAAAALLVARLLETPHQPQFRRLTFRDGLVSRALFVPKSNSILYAASFDGMPVRSYLTLADSPGPDRNLESEPQLPLAFSGDGSQVLVLIGQARPLLNARGTLAWWPTLGGKPRRIMENVGWSDWLDEDSIFATVRDEKAERLLEIRDRNANLLRTLFRSGGGIAYVQFSPDGKHVAFIHYPARHDDAGEVWIAATDGSGSRSLTPKFERCVGLDWNRNTGQIWFTASRGTAYSSSVYSVSVAGKWRVLHPLPDFFVLQAVAEQGDRCLLISVSTHAALTIHRKGLPPKDLSWRGWSVVFDISPDDKNVLFNDGDVTDRTMGTWVRSLDGGDAILLGSGQPGAFSPDGRSVVTLTRPPSGPQQIVLVGVDSGSSRQLTSSAASHSVPSFAGPRTILFVRFEAGESEVWRMETDGSGQRSLGASGCEWPAASPSGTAFLCRAGEPRGAALFVYPMEKGPGRQVYLLAAPETFVHARWDRTGERIFAMVGDGRLITLDSRTGEILNEETSPLEQGRGGALLAGAVSSDASIRAYSVARLSSALYLWTGI